MTLFNFARAKDAAVEQAIRLFVSSKLNRYGELRQLNVDTSARRLTAELQMRGDPLPLIISEAYYEIQQENDEWFLALRSIKVSREWVQNLLEDYGAKLRFKIPDMVGRMLG
jgi:hypothetical protein